MPPQDINVPQMNPQQQYEQQFAPPQGYQHPYAQPQQPPMQQMPPQQMDYQQPVQQDMNQPLQQGYRPPQQQTVTEPYVAPRNRRSAQHQQQMNQPQQPPMQPMPNPMPAQPQGAPQQTLEQPVAPMTVDCPVPLDAGFRRVAGLSFKDTWQMLLGQMTFGSLTAVIQLVNQIQTPFVSLSAVLPTYIAMLASAERLMELDEIQGEAAPIRENPEYLYRRMDAICARKLSFSYDRDQVLRDASFSLPKGAFAVITGPSGIGKSTLLKLLLGIFRSGSGSLYIKCGNRKVTLDRSTRRLFAYVPQGNLLLSGTLRENLTIVNPGATEEALRQAIHVSAMEDFLPQLPQGLDTVLGESGAGLSEGQAQRLAIARAVLGGAPILLLDECTSALDEATEEKVLKRLKALPDRTCIAVTHRPAALKLCTWRLEVSGGKIRAVKTEN